MAMEGLPEGVYPSGRVPEQLLQEAPILKRRRRRNKEGFAKKGYVSKGFRTRGKYRRRGGGGRGPPGEPGGPWCGLGWGRARHPPGFLVVAPLPYFGDSGRFRHTDFLYDFSGFFLPL